MSDEKGLQVQAGRGFMNPTTVEDGMKLAAWIAKSDLAPKDYKNNPGNVLVAMQMGLEVGLSPMQALQNIAVINGRPSIWGDAMLALVQNHRDFESIDENDSTENVGVCIVKRRGMEPQRRAFTVDMAKKAGLWGKQGPWTTAPARMLKLRARAFALRDTFADALRGLQSAEEQRDIIETTATMTMPQRKTETPTTETAPETSKTLTAEQKQEGIEVNVTIEDVKRLNKKGSDVLDHFEITDSDGVIYTTTDATIASIAKEAKGRSTGISFLPVDGKLPEMVDIKCA